VFLSSRANRWPLSVTKKTLSRMMATPALLPSFLRQPRCHVGGTRNTVQIVLPFQSVERVNTVFGPVYIQHSNRSRRARVSRGHRTRWEKSLPLMRRHSKCRSLSGTIAIGLSHSRIGQPVARFRRPPGVFRVGW